MERCEYCKREFYASEGWGYKKKQGNNTIYFCRYNHMRAYEKTKEKPLRKKGSAKPCKCLETGVVYPSASAAGQITGAGPQNIRWACCAPGRSAGGLHWKWVEEPE